ncbi:MAG: DJ-1/PfpI family protein [Saprospiraceae bacterium]|nr:DJ-1/PfpI family protein [Saprospiraceae bacterium]
MSKNVLIVTGDAGESYEALYAIHRFREAGYQAVVAAPTKRMLHLVIHDFEPGWDTYIEKPGYKVSSDIAFEEVDPTTYDALLVLGGRAPEYLRHNEKLLEIVRTFDRAKKPLLSLCHGIQVLIAAGVVKDRNLTCYENVRFELESVGGKFCAVQAIRDGHLVSGQTWESHPEFYQEVFKCLENLT